MKRKTVPKFTYDGLGFPIELRHVEMLKINDEWTPKIDVEEVADIVIRKLVSQTGRLTGNQIKFIRDYFSMSLREFADNIVNVTHTAVAKWEKCGDEVTRMDVNIEIMLRLYIYEKISMETSEKKEGFYKKYSELKKISSSSKEVTPLQIERRV